MVTVICNDAWRKGGDEDNKVIGDTLKKCKSISTIVTKFLLKGS